MTLDATQVLATAATIYGVGGALSVLLQARQMLARGGSDEVSLRFLTTYVGGYAIWLLYGISVHSVPIVLVHALGLVTGTVTLTVALKLRRPARSAERRADVPPRATLRPLSRRIAACSARAAA